jgi:hypothetical protein
MTRDRDTCRQHGCDGEPRGGGGFSGRFCSTPCELKYEHVRADARDARRDAEREAEERDGL